HFLDYTLRLSPRAEANLRDVDLGTLCHAVLERLVDELASDGASLADLENNEIMDRVDRITAELLPEFEQDMMLGEARNRFLMDRSRGHLARVVRWQRDAARAGAFQPKRVEYPFGYDDADPLILQ